MQSSATKQMLPNVTGLAGTIAQCRSIQSLAPEVPADGGGRERRHDRMDDETEHDRAADHEAATRHHGRSLTSSVIRITP